MPVDENSQAPSPSPNQTSELMPLMPLMPERDSARNDGRDSARNDGRDSAQNDGRDSAQNDGRDSAQNDGRDSAQNDGRDSAQNDVSKSARNTDRERTRNVGRDRESARDATRPMALSLVIPAYNEERRLPASIRDIRSFFGRFGLEMEVLVMVEKSTDRTIEVSKLATEDDPMIQIIDNEVKRGKGYAVRTGMLKARGEFIFFMDADLSTPLAEVLKFLAHFSDHPETSVIAGSRAMAKSQILKKQTWIRRNMGRCFNRFVQVLGVPNISDTQCGFKAFRTKPAQEIFARQKLDGFAFDVEVLILANRLGYKTDVLPVKWVNSADSKVNIFIDPIKMLWDLIRIRRIVQKTLRVQPHAPAIHSSHSPKL